MSVLRRSSLGAASDGSSGRRAVTLISGFLGSGKTTLLRGEVDRAGEGAPAILINDFASATVDDALLAGNGRRAVVLGGGCACCTRLGDLAGALLSLLDEEQRSEGTRRDVVIETSGLSDPGPIAFTIAHDPVLRHHYALGGICVTVDALNGLEMAERHPVVMRQLRAADDLIVTKADLVSHESVDHLVLRLADINPLAAISVTAHGEFLEGAASLGGGMVGPSAGSAGPAGPASSAGSAGSAGSASQIPTASVMPAMSHADQVSTVEFVTQEPLDWEAFAVWLTLLVHRHGPDVLRVKGILDVRDAGPVSINGVQHVIYRPEHLPTAPAGPSRIVFIVQNLDAQLLERSLHTFLAIR